MKNKPTFFLILMVLGAPCISKTKIKEQGFLRKSHQKHTLWIRDLRSGIRKKFIQDQDPGSRG
jgi:hypothetical protein